MELKFRVHSKVRKPIAEVFDAVHNPDKIRQYFATGKATGPLDEGKTVIWGFADHPGVEGEVHVQKVVPHQLIVFEWAGGEGGSMTRVEMTFEAVDPNTTLVSITESGWRDTPEGRKLSYQNCEGWTHMVCYLKAWLENGIKLREGAF